MAQAASRGMNPTGAQPKDASTTSQRQALSHLISPGALSRHQHPPTRPGNNWLQERGASWNWITRQLQPGAPRNLSEACRQIEKEFARQIEHIGPGSPSWRLLLTEFARIGELAAQMRTSQSTDPFAEAEYQPQEQPKEKPHRSAPAPRALPQSPRYTQELPAIDQAPETADIESRHRTPKHPDQHTSSRATPKVTLEEAEILELLRQLKKSDSSDDEKLRHCLNIIETLGIQLELPPQPFRKRDLTRRYSPCSNQGNQPPPLSPSTHTTRQLAAIIPTTTDTLKRHAKRAYERGPLPQPMPRFPDWFVVSRSSPKGGQGCGWKFSRILRPSDS